ncbi:PREDICTED: protein unc-79 homolog, partial [Priapulus caudatus]|uniref:Protein unc-79 homolog n=1 Tax=Priapulus caudatus TaxID=37621 RepID=A0ABM1DZ43_PRICU
MGTRAATFTAKIRNLNDYYQRTVNNIVPLPSGIDIANTLKYFQQTLLSVLKDVPSVKADSDTSHHRDSVRLSMFPNLNYQGLYHAIINIIDVVPLLQFGQYSLGQAIIQTLACLVQFLATELIDVLPYTVASMLAIFPNTLHKEITDLLCNNLLPLTLGDYETDEADEASYARLSTSAVIMMVLQYTDNGAYHSHLLECLMALKRDVAKDLLCVIAYGSGGPRAPAINLLFHYWPTLYCSMIDRKAVQYKFVAWKPITCQKDNCLNTDRNEAVKMCIDPACSIELGDRPPPLYICQECSEKVRAENPDYLADILLPMDYVSLKCENKNCMSLERTGHATCFSFECAGYNRNRPIRYCSACHEMRHSGGEASGEGGDEDDAGGGGGGGEQGKRHVFHATLPSLVDCGEELALYLVETIVSLMKEAQVEVRHRLDMLGEDREKQRPSMPQDADDSAEGEKSEERRLLSRYGIWLVVQLCAPSDSIPPETLGRLLAVIFQWYEATAYLPDDNIGTALESLKTEYIFKWVTAVRKVHFNVFVSCLLPDPPEYARVGGHWDTLATATTRIKDGLNRLFCLIPYDIISFEVWDYIMPYWLEGLQTIIPEDELPELKVLLCKTFDLELCPLPFSVEKMYNFVSVRFKNCPSPVQEQALEWLQLLSSLEIYLPMDSYNKYQTLAIMQTGVQATM